MKYLAITVAAATLQTARLSRPTPAPGVRQPNYSRRNVARDPSRSLLVEYSTILTASIDRNDMAKGWSVLGGDDILNLARASGENAWLDCSRGYFEKNACFALLLLASRLGPEFVAGHQGLSGFIHDNVRGLRKLLLESTDLAIQQGRKERRLGLSCCFARNWIEVFPQVFEIDQGRQTATQAALLKALVVRHRITTDLLLELQSKSRGIQREPTAPTAPISVFVRRTSAFYESAQFLVGDPNTIRLGVSMVRFVGEDGMGPGVDRDWFTSVADQLFAGNLGFFERTEAYTRISEHSNSVENFQYYFRAVGRFMALSIIEGIPVGVYFPAMFYKRLLGQEVVLEDIRLDEPDYYQSLNRILGFTAEQLADIGGPIERSGSIFDLSLENRDNQIRAALQNISINGKFEQFEALREGFLSAIPAKYFAGVTPSEIQSFVLGDSNISVDDLARNIRLDGGYRMMSPQITNLFFVLREYSQEDLRLFLRFVTSNTQLPIGGFGALRPAFTVQSVSRTGVSGSVLLPAAHTCANMLDLPLYENIEELRSSLTRAIRLDSSMGMI